jgi:hypothetical protein
VSCHEPILTGYLTDSIGWAIEAIAWRERMLAGYDEWFRPAAATEGEEQEAILRSYLRGE